MKQEEKNRVTISKTKDGQLLEMEGILLTNFECLGNLNRLKKEILLQLGTIPSSPASVFQTLRKTSKNLVAKSTFYHNFRQLRESGMIKRVNNVFDDTNQPVFAPVSGALVVLLEDNFYIKEEHHEQQGDIYSEPLFELFREFLGPQNTFNGHLVVGSPDPHGEYKARARDGHYAIQLALGLGRYFQVGNFIPRLDQDIIAEKLKRENLVVIGGIYTNTICQEINEGLPARFDKSYGIVSENDIYTDDNDGIICKVPNPFNKNKTIIVLAGLKVTGTKSTILALTRFADKVLEDFYGKRIVRGYDSGTGKIDSIDILE
ncbi:MAG: hypothetical protein ACXAEU_07565 [Candidatus Hodarchaeales archaeon]|jgi:hypothetical protein